MAEKSYFNQIAKRGQLVVISGPRNVGKRSVIQAYLEKHPKACQCITATTRPQGSNEEDGREHYFVTNTEFDRMVRSRQLLDYGYYNRNGYGTPRKAVEEARNAGKNVLLIADVVGAMKIRALCPDATLIFILAPDWNELEARIRKRHAEQPEVIEEHLLSAQEEILCAEQYDYILVNDTVEDTVRRMGQIIHGNRYSRSNMKAFIDSYIESEVKSDLVDEILSL